MLTTAELNARNLRSVTKRRNALREAGFRPVQIWVPNVRDEMVLAEIRRQTALIRNDPHEKEYNAFLESAASLIEGWE